MKLPRENNQYLRAKPGGIIVAGDSDGAQHIIGSVSNLFDAIALVISPYATLSVTGEKQAKDSNVTKEKLLEKYKQEYVDSVETMAKRQ